MVFQKFINLSNLFKTSGLNVMTFNAESYV